MSFEERKIICSFERSHIRFGLYGNEKSDHNSKDLNKSVFIDIMPNNAETVFKIEAKREFRVLSTLPC